MNSKEFEQHLQQSYWLQQIFAELQKSHTEELLKILDVVALATDPKVVQRALQQAIAEPPAMDHVPPFARPLLQASLKRMEQRVAQEGSKDKY